MNTEEKINMILENQKSLMKEIGFVEELLKVLLVNNALDSAEKLEQTEKAVTIRDIEYRFASIEKSQNDNLKLIMQKLNSFPKNNNNFQNDEFKDSSEKYHKSQIGKLVKISNRCNHYFNDMFDYMELSPFSNHRIRTWAIKDYRMGKYKLYWTNGIHTFELWVDTPDVVSP